MKQIENFELVLARPEDIPEIIELSKHIPETADALIGFEKDLPEWVNKKQSLVAKDTEGCIVGHQGCSQWPESGWWELRTAMVHPESRKHGLNTRMKMTMMEHVRTENPDALFVGFTESSSKSRGILEKTSFNVVPMETVPDEFFSVCENPNCWKKTGKDCGCRVYILKP